MSSYIVQARTAKLMHEVVLFSGIFVFELYGPSWLEGRASSSPMFRYSEPGRNTGVTWSRSGGPSSLPGSVLAERGSDRLPLHLPQTEPRMTNYDGKRCDAIMLYFTTIRRALTRDLGL
jgi:hypothetical protein